MKFWRFHFRRRRKVAPSPTTTQDSDAYSWDLGIGPGGEDRQERTGWWRCWWRYLLPCCMGSSPDESSTTEEPLQCPGTATPTSSSEEPTEMLRSNLHHAHNTHNFINTHNSHSSLNAQKTHITYNLHNTRNPHNPHNTCNPHNPHNTCNPHNPHNSPNTHNPHNSPNTHNPPNTRSNSKNLPSQERRSPRPVMSEVMPEKAILKSVPTNPHLPPEVEQINSLLKKVTFKEEETPSWSFRPYEAEEYEMPRSHRSHRQVEKRLPGKERIETIVGERSASEAKPGQICLRVQSFGFPNIGQTCYMNSSLQSLLALTDFMNDISLTEKDWGNFPGAKMLKVLLQLRSSHASGDLDAKIKLLLSFKMAVVMNAPDFMGNLQHDAHEFLTTVLDQVSLIMSAAAEHNIQTIVCPVKKHMQFSVNIIRKCKRCNAKTVRKLQYANLSLQVIPGATVEEMIQRYFTDEDVVFKCEWCESSRSVLSSSLESLPRVFILQLKRFSLDRKNIDPIKLQRDILVRSAQNAACFSLVSVINHLGTLNGGHYVCDCIYPDRSPDDLSDPWMILNDATVILTNGAEICEQRSRLGYILFYKRNDLDISGYE